MFPWGFCGSPSVFWNGPRIIQHQICWLDKVMFVGHFVGKKTLAIKAKCLSTSIEEADEEGSSGLAVYKARSRDFKPSYLLTSLLSLKNKCHKDWEFRTPHQLWVVSFCVCAGGGRMRWRVRGGRKTAVESTVSSYLHVGSGAWTQVARLTGPAPLPSEWSHWSLGLLRMCPGVDVVQ